MTQPPHTPNIRSREWAPLRLSLALALMAFALFAGTPAKADSVFVRFDGLFLDQPDPRNWGIDQSSIDAAVAASIPIFQLNPAMIGRALNTSMTPGPSMPGSSMTSAGPFEIAQNLNMASVVIPDPVSAMNPITATSEWTATNVSMADLSSPQFLIFAAVEPFPGNDPWNGSQVSLGIDSADGWALVETFVMGDRIVYPAMLIDGLGVQQALAFDINYRLDRDLPIGTNDGGTARYLPQFRIASANGLAIIPEPATAVLLGIGVLGLAARRRPPR